MTTVLTGSEGQLGYEIARRWSAPERLVSLAHSDIEITDADQVQRVIGELHPDRVINTAAYVQVDQAEQDAAGAFEVNALAVKHLAGACEAAGATLVHVSTDYVFDGAASTPYAEDAAVAPLNVYGVSKAAGELLLRAVLPDNHLIVRTSGLYSLAAGRGRRPNFIDRVIERAEQGQPVRVVSDQVTSPTYGGDVADCLLQLCALGARGTYHVANAGACSWYEFAAAIFEARGLKPDLEAISSEALASPARRPAYSVLGCERLRELGLAPPRPWREALSAYLRDVSPT